MPLLSKVGSFSGGTGALSSTVVITGLGFTPKALIFWYSGRSESSDTIGRASHYRGFGIATGDSSRAAACSNSLDAQATTDANRAHSNAACILSVSAGSAVDGALDLQSLDTDGFTLVVDDVMPRDLRVSYLALGGDSITNATVGVFQEAAATGNQATTGAGFQPDFLFFIHSVFGTAPAAGTTHSQMGIGAAVSSSQQACWCGDASNAAATSDTGTYCTDANCLGFIGNPPTAIVSRATHVSMDADGFTLNWLERNSTRYVFYLALKGGNYRVGNFLTQTDTVTDIAQTGFGFRPSAAMLISHLTTESASDTAQAEDRLSVGAFSSLSDRNAQAVFDEDNLADSEVTTAIELDEVYINIASTSVVQGLMDVKSIDSDGFTMIMDDADPGQNYVWYMAFGPGGSSAALLPENMKGNFRNPSGRFIN